MKQRKRLAILISGRGSNMEAILAATKEPDYSAEIVLVLSDHENAGGLAIARNAGIETAAFERPNYPDKQSHEAAIIKALETSRTDLICLAGYMRILSADFVKRFERKIINIHPSLLPKYKGLDTHKRVLESGDKEHGFTIHYVNSKVDDGEIISQLTVPVLNGDTEESLSARVLKAEHRLYPEVIRILCK